VPSRTRTTRRRSRRTCRFATRSTRAHVSARRTASNAIGATPKIMEVSGTASAIHRSLYTMRGRKSASEVAMAVSSRTKSERRMTPIVRVRLYRA
jgi:hypothetical protein